MKVVRLTESDLTRIIKRVILESDPNTLKIEDLKGKDVKFFEETGLITRERQYKISEVNQNIKLSPKNLDTLNITLVGGKQLTYNCEGAFVDLKQKVEGDVTFEKKSFAGWKKYTKWKSPVLQNIIEKSGKFCGSNTI